MYKDTVILTKYDIKNSPNLDMNNLSLRDFLFKKSETYYKASHVIYINDMGDIKVLKDRTGELTHELIGINIRRQRQLQTPYYTGNENVKYTLTRKGKKIKS